jgi:hypothetical protein
MSTLPLLEDEMHRLVDEAQRRGIFLRLMGGLAVKVHCDRAAHRALMRDYPDIDFVTNKAGALRLEAFLVEMGYTPNKTFNTLSGDHRQLYHDQQRNRQIDIFIGDFHMCHRLPLSDRLEVEPLTIPLAELFLTKAQIVQLNRKDVLDLLSMLLEHDVGPGDKETINGDVIASLCAKDWGLYTTITQTMERLRTFMTRDEADLLDQESKALISGHLDKLQAALESAPKNMQWKLRSRMGTRVPWYDEVEEVHR